MHADRLKESCVIQWLAIPYMIFDKALNLGICRRDDFVKERIVVKRTIFTVPLDQLQEHVPQTPLPVRELEETQVQTHGRQRPELVDVAVLAVALLGEPLGAEPRKAPVAVEPLTQADLFTHAAEILFEVDHPAAQLHRVSHPFRDTLVQPEVLVVASRS